MIFSTRFFVALLFFQMAVTAAQAESFFSYEGQLFDSGNLPVTTTTTLNFSVLSGTSCVLYSEQQAVTPTTQGDFAAVVGAGTRQDGTGNTITQIFAKVNSGAQCEGSVGTYDPAAIRYLRVTINGEVVTPDARITSVPYAFEATRLESKAAADFLNITTPQGLTQANAESVFSRFTKLDAILNNFNSGGTTLTGSVSGNAATATTATNVTGTVAIANGGTGATTVAGVRTNLGLGILSTMSPTGTASSTTYLRGDGTWSTVSGGAGAVSSVAGHTGDVVLASTDVSDFVTATSSVITAKKDVVNGIAGLDSSSKIPASLMPNSAYFTNWVKAGNLKLAGPSSTEIGISAPPSGLTSYNLILPTNTGAVGNILKVQNVNSSDVTLDWAVDALGGAGGGIASIGLNLPTSVFSNGATLTADGTLSATFQNQTANTVFVAPNGVAGTPSFRALAASDIPTLTTAKITGLGTVATINTTGSTSTYLRADGTWAAVAGGANFTGALSGDVAGTQFSTEVVGLRGSPLSATSPSSTGQVLQWYGGAWTPMAFAPSFLSTAVPVSKGGTGTTSGSITGTSGLAFAAGGTNQSIVLTPSGTGTVGAYGQAADFTIVPTSSTYLDVRGDSTVVQIAKTKSKILSGYASGGAIYMGNGQSDAGGETATGAIETSWDGGVPKIGIGAVRDNSGARLVMDQLGVFMFEHRSAGTNYQVAKFSYASGGGNLDVAGCVKTNGSSIGGTCSSDLRLKKDISSFDLGMDVLLGMRPKWYRYNGLGESDATDKPGLGVIAQELELVAPSLIQKTKVKMHAEDKELTEIKQVNYSSFTYVIINAVKEFYQKWSEDSQQLHRGLASVQSEAELLRQENVQMKSWICQQNPQAPFCTAR